MNQALLLLKFITTNLQDKEQNQSYEILEAHGGEIKWMRKRGRNNVYDITVKCINRSLVLFSQMI
jgi:hypothetical protein